MHTYWNSMSVYTTIPDITSRSGSQSSGIRHVMKIKTIMVLTIIKLFCSRTNICKKFSVRQYLHPHISVLQNLVLTFLPHEYLCIANLHCIYLQSRRASNIKIPFQHIFFERRQTLHLIYPQLQIFMPNYFWTWRNLGGVKTSLLQKFNMRPG